MVSVTYDPALVIASVLVAIMGAFTGLRLTSGLRHLDPAARRPRIAEAAVALGGSIWSMHFVGMLAVSIPLTISYSALPTLLSALVAILVVGVGLIALHFGARTQDRILIAGTLTGLGIVSMHYIGMTAITGNCVIAYKPIGLVLSTAIGIGSSILALELAYRRRTWLMTACGAVVLGLAISAMHYVAMIFTTFEATDTVVFVATPILSTGTLAMIVALASFVICGLFLLMAIPVENQARLAMRPVGVAIGVPGGVPGGIPRGAPVTVAGASGTVSVPPKADSALSKAYVAGGPNERKPDPALSGRIPYERDNTIRFLTIEQISAFRADGHYTRVINGSTEFFCPWSISRVEKAIETAPFIRTHRSYLVNLRHVAGFKREGDKAFCFLIGDREIRIPVSRSRISDVQKALGLQ
ncbi:MHYT domain-containing protein [Microbaculum sp. FT89]|uniref:MHYT domain-containing protein n=1 Tax=Microbaculum sp. FT89 TaxID=3447298 RepID=UPI003F53CE0B